jgi:BlaI family penicillinase repressor
MMSGVPKISQAEWWVMKTLWSESPLTANEIVAELTEKTEWKPKTIKTLIHRLLRKGAVHFEKEGAQYKYYPVVSKAECVRAERRCFVRRVYGGEMKPVLEDFLKEAELSEENGNHFKQILEEKTERRR